MDCVDLVIPSEVEGSKEQRKTRQDVKAYFIYMMTNKSHTTVYIGVTSSLVRRVSQHRNGETDAFTKRYNTNRLVYYETYNDVNDAIAREKQLKRWSRTKKEKLISDMNPDWTDLSVSVLGLNEAPAAAWKEGGGWHDGDLSTSSR